MAQRNLYDVLGVPRTASEAEIRKAYRKVARENHPDRNPDNKQAEDLFKEASYAKDVLLNKKKRELYDEFGETGLKEGFDAEAYRQYNAFRQRPGAGAGGFAGQVNLEDLFASVRGAGVGGPGAGGGGPQNWSGNFQEFINPGVVDSIFGRDRQRERKRDLVSEISVSFADAIRGVEKEISFRDPRSSEERVLRVRIPAGVDDGGKVRLRGQGTEGGDLVLKVHVGSHPHFARDGSDLLLNLPVTVSEAYKGGKVPVPTPDGEVLLAVPAGVKSGAKLRLRGKGVKRGSETGDLIVTVLITLPPKDNEEAKLLVDALEDCYEGSVRDGVTL